MPRECSYIAISCGTSSAREWRIVYLFISVVYGCYDNKKAASLFCRSKNMFLPPEKYVFVTQKIIMCHLKNILSSPEIDVFHPSKNSFSLQEHCQNFNLKNVKLSLFKKQSFLFFTPKNRPKLPKKTVLIIRTIFLPNFTQVLTKFLSPFTSVEYGQNFVRVF